MSTLLSLQLSVTSFLCGLIWVIQVVHYPSFHHVPESGFKAFHHFHQKAITWVVAPLMMAELGLAALLALRMLNLWTLLNLLSVIAIWLSTFLLSVPLHTKLAEQRAEREIQRLIRTNWPRTIFWTLRMMGLLLVLINN